jgi:sugar phosphate isomerase/epimerase
MKIGFSSLVAPVWDLETLIDRAADWGFDGVELRGIRGELHLPAALGLSRPDRVQGLFSARGVELVCLGSSVSLTFESRHELARQKALLTEYFELAHRLGCPFVRLFAGEAQKGHGLTKALVRAAGALNHLADSAARLGVTMLVENGGDYPGSQDMWYLMDAVNHPNVRCCWNQCHALAIGERPTFSLPRLGSKLGLVHVCDATFDEQGVLLEYKSPGEGHAEIAKQIEILRGIIYRGYLVFEWPKLWDPSLPNAESVLPVVAAFLKAQIEARQGVLSAYKGDKNAPRFHNPRALSQSTAEAAGPA